MNDLNIDEYIYNLTKMSNVELGVELAIVRSLHQASPEEFKHIYKQRLDAIDSLKQLNKLLED